MDRAERHIYTGEFFDFLDAGARRSAAHVLAVVAPEIRPKTVLDVGCGRGAWLAEWRATGEVDVMGVDGEYVEVERLHVPREHFVPHDVGREFDLNRRFDLVQSLEVAEHLPAACADTFVDNLARHGDVILFSAAVPGQGGEHHVNEQPYEYWRSKFAQRGYRVFDCVRARILRNAEIQPWYRYNVVLFARKDGIDRLSQRILSSEIPASQPIPDVSPLLWRVRNACLRAIPQPGIDALSRLKGRVVTTMRKMRSAGP